MFKIAIRFFFPLVLLFAFTTQLNAQDKKEKVRISPKAEIQQTVGFTPVTVSFSRPGVKSRKIWGGLVPYNKVWRAGANEATKFTFTDEVLINGNKLSKGYYSFFAIPTENEWTLIFNKVADQWGAFEYNEAEDALRITVTPEENCFTEWLDYSFQKTGDYTAEVSLDWENLRVPFTIEAVKK